MTHHDTLISLRNVGVSYDGHAALEGINLDIYSDDFVGIIGPNGGGKSSLIKAILGYVPYSGTIDIAPTLSHGNHSLIGYMPQVSQFDTEFPISIGEVVLSGLQSTKGVLGRYNSSDKEKAHHLLEEMNIAHLEQRPIGEVSGGELQRALLCRAIVSDPKLLILDEPTNFVDNQFEHEFYDMLQRLCDKMAIMLISHDLGTITSIVKSIICVNRHVHRHDSNILTEEQLLNYDCPIQLLSHGHVPHTILKHHHRDGCRHHE